MPEEDPQAELETIISDSNFDPVQEDESPFNEEETPVEMAERVGAGLFLTDAEQPPCPVVDPHSFEVLRGALGCGDEPSNDKVILMAARKIRRGVI